MLTLHNTLTKSLTPVQPLDGKTVRIYSCGPTVYDHAHIGNLSAFIFADTLRRVIGANDIPVIHAMNFTDVDDKTIRRSKADYPDEAPLDALQKTTAHYTELFLADMQSIGNDTNAYQFIRATDPETIDGMKALIRELLSGGFAYVADDGVYFSIEAYKKSGKTYGQLVEITSSSTSQARISNDEYDKESAHDFALWKKQSPGEPAWEFDIDGVDMAGRPGWHIECSVMSKQILGQPFDIHTGGIDLAFPHHENEIAQSTAGHDSSVYASIFAHNGHMLVDGRKMSKSLGNFYTLADLIAKGVDPLAFRLLVLQSQYRSETNFSFESIESAANRLQHWRDIACLRWQTNDTLGDDDDKDTAHSANGIILSAPHAAMEALNDDINTPRALAAIDRACDEIDKTPLADLQHSAITQFVTWVDDVFGLQLAASTPDISDEQKKQIVARRHVRDAKDWKKSDDMRDQLAADGIQLRDTAHNTIWTRA